MGKCYCDYCDVFLTHDSASVRKQHNDGNRHRQNVSEYYRLFIARATQERIDNIVYDFEHRLAKGLVLPTYGVSAIDGCLSGATPEKSEGLLQEKAAVDTEEIHEAMVGAETPIDRDDSGEAQSEDADSDDDLASSPKSCSQPSKHDELLGGGSGAESSAPSADQIKSATDDRTPALAAAPPHALEIDVVVNHQTSDSGAAVEKAENDEGSDMELDDDL
jgi:hypothetical protein